KRLTEIKEVPAALREFIKFEGPAFLEVMIDPNAKVFPMVGPGLSYKDMITGDFIPKREPEVEEKQAPEPIDMTKIPDLF
ncbi:MAG: acetolactate synthase, large subunit, biosynthetic type, partial [Candidatus Hydrogenedentes bacterium]|nr:acetolactate synthase, large subunit, biosynthetic type [Candidatus Hydrogenedentota bacterium]